MFYYCAIEDRATLQVSGSDAMTFLQGIVTNDVPLLDHKPGLFAAMLSAQGKFLYDFFMVAYQDGVLIDLEADVLDDVIKKFKLYRLRSRVDIHDVSSQWQAYALWGKHLTQAFIPTEALHMLDPRLNALGMRLYCPSKIAYDPGPEAQRCQMEDYHAHRLAHGVPDGSVDAGHRNFLLELGYDQLNGVSFTKGCYIGQEPTARMHHRNVLRKCLFQLHAVDEGHSLPVSGTPITVENKEIGDMRSSAGGAGLAQLRIEDWQHAQRDDLPILAGPVAVNAQPPAYMRTRIAELLQETVSDTADNG